MAIFDNLLIGSHVSMKSPNYLVGSINEAISYGANCLMFYTGSPQSTNRANINDLKIDEFKKIAKTNHIDLEHVIVHAQYIINLANSDKLKHNFAINFISTEIKRCMKIGAKYLILHPGNATNCSVEEGIKNIANGINQILKKVGKTNVVICLETMSGKANEIGRDFQQLKNIIDLINLKKNIGVCLDTCHINDSGYDINDFDNVINKFDKIIGLDKLKIIHLNDSKNPKGAHKDRHENIGYGTLGFNNLLKVVYHNKLTKIPKILETPWYNNKPCYKQEIEIIKNKKWKEFK
ncbi:MAG: deoxyribonuclease IV [Mycoplasma sp.]|nr:deoxyribonuclease IV [Mycoplasma sp.]